MSGFDLNAPPVEDDIVNEPQFCTQPPEQILFPMLLENLQTQWCMSKVWWVVILLNIVAWARITMVQRLLLPTIAWMQLLFIQNQPLILTWRKVLLVLWHPAKP